MRKADRYLEHLAKVPMFSACTKKELQLLGRAAEDIDFAAGTDVITQGTTGREFYVIAEGTAEVRRDGSTVATLGPGAWFGELSLLDKAPRNATVTATSRLRTSLLGQREFASVLAEVPAITDKLLRGMARRIHELEGRV